MGTFDGWSDDAILHEIGERARQTRLNRNESQAEIADRAGISVETVRKLEDGNNVSLTTLIKLMRALRILDHVDGLIPAPGLSPMQLLELQGKRRRRASGSRRG